MEPNSLTSRKDDASETLWVTDAELIRRSGVPEKIMRDAIKLLDERRDSGFPPKRELFGNRRHWPSVKAYFERVGTANMDASKQRRAS